MKIEFRTVLALSVGLLALPCDAEEKAAMTNLTDRVSYSLGMNIGNGIKRAGYEIDVDTMARAIKDVLAGRELKLTDAEAQEIGREYQKDLAARRDAARLKLAEKNRQEGEVFLRNNKTKPGIKTHPVTMPDGSLTEIQYKVLTEGQGDSPKVTDVVSFTFRGTLINGTEFDSSDRRGGQAIKVPLNRAPLRGLAEAFSLMKSGSKWILYLPASLAFGDFGNGQNVDPGSAVIVEVTLVGVDAPPPIPASPDNPKPLTSDIIRVPSRDEINQGAKIEVIKAEDVEKQIKSNSASGKKP